MLSPTIAHTIRQEIAALQDFSPPVSPSKRTWASSPRYLPFKPLAYLAVRLSALHMMVSQASSTVEHEAIATVLIIGASRGIGLETVKAALEAGHSVRALARSARRIPIDRPKLEKMSGDALETRPQ